MSPEHSRELSRERPPLAHARSQRLVMVDATPDMASMLSRDLSRRGYEVLSYPDADSALRSLRRDNPDLILLDVELPDFDGIDVCMRIREWSSIPIIMLSSRDSVSERVEGLRVGADDYLTRPFAMEELAARIEAVLRRHPREQQYFEHEDLVIDIEWHRCLRAGREIELTHTEFSLLETLARLSGRVISRRTLATAVWPRSDFVDDGVIDTHVTNLRRKLEAGGGRRLVQTVRGVGFTLR